MMHGHKSLKDEGKVYPVTCQKGKDGEQKCSYALSSNSGLDVGGSFTPRLCHFTSRNDPVPVVQEAGWDIRPIWTAMEL